MNVDDHGLEVIKKAARNLDPTSKRNYALQVILAASDVILQSSTSNGALETTQLQNKAELQTINAALAAIFSELQLKADLSETQPVSAASLPLPTGAATQATLAALLTELQLKADLSETQPVSITDAISGIKASVVSESGFNKLLVKSSLVPQIVGNLYFERVLNGTNSNIVSNGSLATPIVYTIPADPSSDLVISSLSFECIASGIKIGNFLAGNSVLTNGLVIEVKSQNSIFQFLPIRSTAEFDSRFSWGQGADFKIIIASGGDYCSSKFEPRDPFILKKQGTYGTDDYIKVINRDNLNPTAASIKLYAFGSKDM